MPSPGWAKVPALGVGMTYFPGLESLLETGGDLLDFIEIEPETLWVNGPAGETLRQRSTHAWLKQQTRPIVLHGVGTAIGGSAPLCMSHARELKRDVQQLSPAWVSEHLAFDRYQVGTHWQQAGFFLPPLQTESSIQIAAEQLQQRRELGLPVAFETGVNYLQPQLGEMPDGEYWAALAEQADVGILLDLHNLWTNERNGRCKVSDVLKELPLHRVVELHVAGGEARDGYWLDAHTCLAPEPVLEIARELAPELPALRGINLELVSEGVLVNKISVRNILDQLEDLQEIWLRREPAASTRSTASNPIPAESGTGRHSDLPEPEAWEQLLGRAIHNRPLEPSPASTRLEADPGVPVYQELINAARRGQLVAALPLTFRELFARGGQIAEQRAAEYLRESLPTSTAIDEAQAFIAYAEERGWELTAELARFELLELEVQQSGEARTLDAQFDFADLVNELRSGRRPESRPPRQNIRLILEPELVA